MKKMKWLKGLMFALVCVWITSSSLIAQAETTDAFSEYEAMFPVAHWKFDYNPLKDVLVITQSAVSSDYNLDIYKNILGDIEYFDHRNSNNKKEYKIVRYKSNKGTLTRSDSKGTTYFSNKPLYSTIDVKSGSTVYVQKSLPPEETLKGIELPENYPLIQVEGTDFLINEFPIELWEEEYNPEEDIMYIEKSSTQYVLWLRKGAKSLLDDEGKLRISGTGTSYNFGEFTSMRITYTVTTGEVFKMDLGKVNTTFSLSTNTYLLYSNVEIWNAKGVKLGGAKEAPIEIQTPPTAPEPPTNEGGDEIEPPTDEGGDEIEPPTDEGGDGTEPPTDEGGDGTEPPIEDGGTEPPVDDEEEEVVYVAPSISNLQAIESSEFDVATKIQFIYDVVVDEKLEDKSVEEIWGGDYKDYDATTQTFKTAGNKLVTLRVKDSNGKTSNVLSVKFTVYNEDGTLPEDPKLDYEFNVESLMTYASALVQAYLPILYIVLGISLGYAIVKSMKNLF